jgi:hypothetical protein
MEHGKQAATSANLTKSAAQLPLFANSEGMLKEMLKNAVEGQQIAAKPSIWLTKMTSSAVQCNSRAVLVGAAGLL